MVLMDIIKFRLLTDQYVHETIRIMKLPINAKGEEAAVSKERNLKSIHDFRVH